MDKLQKGQLATTDRLMTLSGVTESAKKSCVTGEITTVSITPLKMC